MVHAKNDETVSTFVKVMPKKPWPLFFRTRCSSVDIISYELISGAIQHCAKQLLFLVHSQDGHFEYRLLIL